MFTYVSWRAASAFFENRLSAFGTAQKSISYLEFNLSVFFCQILSWQRVDYISQSNELAWTHVWHYKMLNVVQSIVPLLYGVLESATTWYNQTYCQKVRKPLSKAKYLALPLPTFSSSRLKEQTVTVWVLHLRTTFFCWKSFQLWTFNRLAINSIAVNPIAHAQNSQLGAVSSCAWNFCKWTVSARKVTW